MDVRLIKNKMTGESRGFAFVDFSTVQEAQGFIDYNNGIFTIDGRNVTLDYSTSGVPAAPGASGVGIAVPQQDRNALAKDWICQHVCSLSHHHGSGFASALMMYTCSQFHANSAKGRILQDVLHASCVKQQSQQIRLLPPKLWMRSLQAL